MHVKKEYRHRNPRKGLTFAAVAVAVPVVPRVADVQPAAVKVEPVVAGLLAVAVLVVAADIAAAGHHSKTL